MKGCYYSESLMDNEAESLNEGDDAEGCPVGYGCHDETKAAA